MKQADLDRNEIIEMAKLVVGNYEHAHYWPFFTEELEHFAKLVAAKEREACAKLCVKLTDDWLENHHPVNYAKAIRARGQL